MIDDGILVAYPHNPAFEVIFIHDDESRTLSIWHDGDRERIKDLQVAFAQAVLGSRIERNSPRDDRVYDLQRFLDPDFAFKPEPVLGIESVELRKIRVRVSGRNGRTFLVDLNKETPRHVLHQDMGALLADVLPSLRRVTMVGLQVKFDLLANETDQRKRTFQIATPNSCNLKIDDFSPLIERLLVDHRIEPRRPGSGPDDAER